jgi:predicted RNA-binding Zn-ribbon protein involved in translation (DUF1610 family)
MWAFVGRLPFLSSRIPAESPGESYPTIEDVRPSSQPRVRPAHTERAASPAHTSPAHDAPSRATLPCPMCDDARVERHQEMAVTTVFVCLMCGYRFGMRIR